MRQTLDNLLTAARAQVDCALLAEADLGVALLWLEQAEGHSSRADLCRQASALHWVAEGHERRAALALDELRTVLKGL